MEAERIVPPTDAHNAAPADIDDGGLATLEKTLGAGLGDAVDDEFFARRRDAADNHAVEMTIGEINLARPEHRLDDEAVAQALRVAPGGVLRSDDLAY